MIDFAKTNPLPNGIQINHRNPWVVGNHEDGYLTGLHHLMDLFEQLLDERQGNHWATVMQMFVLFCGFFACLFDDIFVSNLWVQ